jgi:hypothetical protein
VQERGLPVRVGVVVLADVAEQHAGMCEQVSVDPDQVACLA